MSQIRSGGVLALLGLCLAWSVHAAAPTAAITASPIEGRAPLAVFFDASASSPEAETFLWEFGDGAASTAKTVSHIYNVPGTYIVELTVANAAGEVSAQPARITIVVTGNVEGPVTEDMNFRIAPLTSDFRIAHGRIQRDSFNLNAVFNTVDLPARLDGLAVRFDINGIFKIEGVLTEDGELQNPERQSRPNFFLNVNVREQVLNVFISRADLATALAASGAGNIDSVGIEVPVTLGLTIGAQSYTITLAYDYTSRVNGTGIGKFEGRTRRGAYVDGVFAVSRASALEDFEGDGHFFEFEGYLAMPNDRPVMLPTSGNWIFRFNDADPITIPFDRVRIAGTKIIIDQPDRDLNGLKLLNLDTISRRFTIRTWDIDLDTLEGGSGLPRRGQSFTSFNFALRLDLDQPDGNTFRVVTATRMTRKTKDDGFWQTGRRAQRR